MTLCLKSIFCGNFNDKPFFSKNNKEKWLDIMKNSSNDSNNLENDDLMIICLQNVYGYRTGIFGYLSTLLIDKLNNCVPKTFIFKSICNYLIKSNFNCNDLEVLSGIISIINRTIPLLNYGIWDNKSFFSNNLNLFNVNDSEPIRGMFDFYSNFLFKPFFDSGLCILSNKKYHDCGFEKLQNPVNSFVNEGFLWCCFKEDVDEKIIFVITFNISSNDENKLEEIIQLLDLKDKLLLKFPSYYNEIYIIGDFKTNISKYEYLFKKFFKISKDNDTLYLLYKNNVYRTPMTNMIDNDEKNYYKIFNFNKKRSLSPVQKILQIKKIKLEQEQNNNITENNDNIVVVDADYELKQVVVVDTVEENVPNERKDEDSEKIMMYKKLSIMTSNNLNIIENPVENYFYKPSLPNKSPSDSEKSTNTCTDEEWTRIDEDEIKI
jgi:hypothetical protein